MKWEAHTRTAERILSDFDAYHFKKYEKDLVNGIIYPDSNDPQPHTEREDSIRENIRKARDRRLEYNPSDSFFYLGIAFHYIQDSWVGMDPDHEGYDSYVKQIDKSRLLPKSDDLFKYYPIKRNRVLVQFMELESRLANPVKTTQEMYKLTTMRKPYESSALLDLNFSYRVCFRVAEMVLQPMLKVSLDEGLSKLHREYTEKLVKKEENEQENLFFLEKALETTQKKGLFSKYNRWKRRRKLTATRERYENGLHLDKTESQYMKEAKTMAKPYVDWYNVKIPELILPEPEVESVPEEESYLSILKREEPIIPV